MIVEVGFMQSTLFEPDLIENITLVESLNSGWDKLSVRTPRVLDMEVLKFYSQRQDASWRKELKHAEKAEGRKDETTNTSIQREVK